MTPLQELEVRAADIRRRFGEIGGMSGDDLTEEITAELAGLRAEHATNELRQTALKLSGDVAPTPIESAATDGVEYRNLLRNANVGEIFHVAVHGGVTRGATAELQQAHNLDVRQVPLALLIQDMDGLETRAAVAAPADVQGNQQSILMYVFPQSAGTWLGIDAPSVPTGEAIFPILSTAPTVSTPAESAAAGEATATFTSDVLVPKRVQAAFRYTREDRARFAGMDSALRENLSMGISDKLDSELLAGAGGLFTGTILADHDSGTAVTTYAQYRSQLLFSRIDGRYANGVGEIKILMGSDSYAHAAGQYRGNNDNMDALMSLISQSGGVRVSSHVPATATTKQDALVRRGMRRDFVQPVWDSVEIIPDEITAADEGEIIITAVGLFAQKLLRSDGFYKQELKVS